MGVMSRGLILGLALALLVPAVAVAEDAGEPFGDLPLVDEVIVGTNEEDHEFTESPAGASEIQEILGTPTRVLPNTGGPRYFAYRIGANAGLEAGKAYVLAVEYPEDAPRTVYVINRGAEANRGFSTGQALGDVVKTYTAQNLESVDYPLSGESRWWRTFFHLHDRFGGIQTLRGGDTRPGRPADGFWVIVAQPGKWQGSGATQAPVSEGAAISRIRLFEVPNPESHYPTISYPGELPRRHIFWREEMADGVVHVDGENTLGVEPTVDWYRYKAELMRFLGINTFGKDLLEFGHNQGFDSNYKDYGGNSWYWNARDPSRWADIITMLEAYDHYVLPYFEYTGSRGSDGLGDQRRCLPLTRDDSYTHITWSENACVDVSDPDFVVDAKKLLDTTVLQYADRANILGAWFRTRVSHFPMSFTDATLARFAEDEGLGPVTRADLQGDGALLERYYAWWYGQRQGFLTALRDYLQQESGQDMKVFLTAYNEEGGPGLGGDVVTDDLALWQGLGFDDVRTHQEIYDGDLYAQRIVAPPGTWGGWEWHHSLPAPDPQNYANVDDVLFTHPFNRLYTVGDPDSFDLMRTPGGLAILYHYSLNENVMTTEADGELVGYFVTDVERAGPYVTLPEARALAYGDPRYIGYLSGHSFNRGFPTYVRNFNLAFLALPAIPSQLVAGATPHEEVVVRHWPTDSNTDYFAVINVGLRDADAVQVTLPPGRVVDAVTGEEVSRSGDAIELDLYPGQVRALELLSDEEPGEPDAGGGGGDGGDGGTTDPTPGPSPDGGTSGGSGDAGDGTGRPASVHGTGGGCTCTSAGGSGAASAGWLLMLAGLVVALRRRRVRSAPATTSTP